MKSPGLYNMKIPIVKILSFKCLSIRVILITLNDLAQQNKVNVPHNQLNVI